MCLFLPAYFCSGVVFGCVYLRLFSIHFIGSLLHLKIFAENLPLVSVVFVGFVWPKFTAIALISFPPRFVVAPGKYLESIVIAIIIRGNPVYISSVCKSLIDIAYM